MTDTPRLPQLKRIQTALLSWHRTHGLSAPWRESGDPYLVLVAAVMAQQTQMSRVMPSYERFVAAYPTLESLAVASLGDVIRVWKGMGYNQRAVRLHRAARTIAASGWPREAGALARIDGIGPFTAAIIASFSFGQPAAAVDTNVVRVLTRLAGDGTLSGKRLQQFADTLIPHDQPARWNQALMDYGARVCGVRPRCGECVIAKWCPSRGAITRPVRRTAPGTLVAEGRVQYEARFEHSDRYFRGRIIDTLRDVTPGRYVPIAAISSRIANDRMPTETEVRGWLGDLERSGLVEMRGNGVRLPV
jgi:A/G-specific adenine glycosylase